MGNSQSNENKTTPSTPTSPAHGLGGAARQNVARRKESVPVLSQANSKSTNAPPTASLISTSSSASTATQPTRAHAHATVTPSPASSHSRARSITGPNRVDDQAHAQKAESPNMGNDLSRLRPPSRASTLPTPPPLTATHDASTQPKVAPSPSSQPVNVPVLPSQPPANIASFTPSGPPADDPSYSHVPNYYTRPPRLPLPIEEEVYTPGSPIITPADISSPIDEKEVDGALPRRTSVLSSTTADDDEIGDNDGFTTDQSLAPTVPITIEWRGPGEKVYVTGTFVLWERKFKLHRDKESDRFAATLQLKPGTHHIKFLVDGDMTTSENLPTTVDFTNILVNYVEVVAPLPTAAEQKEPTPSEPMPIPGTAITAGQAEGTNELAACPVETLPDGAAEAETLAATALPPQPAQPQESQPIPVPETRPRAASPSPRSQPQPPEHQQSNPPKQIRPEPKYTTQIPQFLLDLDNYSNPHDERFQRASRVATSLPHPPSLPMFLAKSILNGQTPHKDDASVLIMPNHTVLNHLATSSIKSGVLATSGTTRYKRKFLTTILYKPTSNEGR